jgi:hypothetical protein
MCSILSLLLLLSPTASICIGQTTQDQTENRPTAPEVFRLETIEVPGGATLITIHARWQGSDSTTEQDFVPVVSVLRDNLGDSNPENDRLRYVWPLSYTRPTFWQRISGAIPFLYARVGNKPSANKPPPPAIDLASTDNEVWEKIFWTALQNMLLDPYGAPVKASTRSYRRNITDYRKSQIVRALSVLSLYESINGTNVFSTSEMAEIQSRLLLTDKTFGGIIDEMNLEPYYERHTVETRDERGHNWELLRQRAEAESLYFEPLEMPDGSMTHAILWVAKDELTANKQRDFNKRFLNIASPWGDKRLLNWKGYQEVRYFDAENRPISHETANGKRAEMIPLALYGLDNPKIPALLVDFRDGFNPKKREMSRRLLQDITRNILSLSKFGDLPYFVGRSLLDFTTGRRGIDFNQPSRLRTYSQLKLLLALNESLEPELRTEVAARLEKASLNPMENDIDTEAKIAEQQYKLLIRHVNDPNGLAEQLDRDRRKEMVKLEHSKADQVVFKLANILTFGKYVHRERPAPEMEARLDVSRRLAYHTKFLRAVARSSPQIEVKWDLQEVQRSLLFIGQHGNEADSQAVAAAAKIFARTSDGDTRRACIESLSRIAKPKARVELIRLAQTAELEPALRELISAHLASPERPIEPLTSSIKVSGGGAEQH